ncbi:IQ and ubiquitin-like domain-containing protein [Folsomia candida]|uniref:IQ and ubiquitin-like domain-containing protein n=1 Tax=Folsomia candida TaxID=158441 RepID=A0A226CYA4_FOLCA|nr:IQ and ubiquitin-like domain-containing protein [Folsomia candida]
MSFPQKNQPDDVPDDEEIGNDNNEEGENEDTIKEIESILAQFDAQEEEQDGDQVPANEEEQEQEQDIVPYMSSFQNDPQTEVEEILAPAKGKKTLYFRSRSSSNSRISLQEQLDDDQAWTIQNDVEYNSDEDNEAEDQENGDHTELAKLLQEISNFEENLENPADLPPYDPAYDADYFYDYDYTLQDDDDGTYVRYSFEDNVENEDEEEEDEILPRIDSSQAFLDTVMTIPEEEGDDALDKAALMSDVKDLLASFCQDESRVCDDEETTPVEESSTLPVHDRCPSIESFFKQERGASVFIYLVPGRKMMSKHVPLDTTIFQLKSSVSRFCKLSPELLDFRLKHNLLSNAKTLLELGATPQKKMRFTVELNKRMVIGDVLPILHVPEISDKPETERGDTVQMVNVVVKDGDDQGGVVTTVQRKVVVVHPKERKPMLGGFKDKRTATVYHDAATMVATADLLEGEETEEDVSGEETCRKVDILNQCQVWKKGKKPSTAERMDRVYSNNEITTQTPLSTWTQVDVPGVYYSSEGKDIVVYSKRYRTYEEVQAERARAVTTIAKYWRKLTAKRNRQRRFDTLIARVDHAEKIRKGRQEERKRIMEEELHRQQNPTRLLDLELLYREINNWREEQETYILKNRWGPERKAALATLAEMESDLLLELERTKRNIITRGRNRFMHGQFKQMCLPRRWFNPKSSCFLSFDTEGRVKCRKLHDIYKALLQRVEPTEEGHRRRLDLIKGVHKLLMIQTDTMKRAQIPLADMLTELFSREIKFMNTPGVNKLLSGIRKRVANTFFYLCMDPAFNDDAQRVDKVFTDNCPDYK